ncbi:MAG TPA: cobalamin-dependent protein [Nocardioidaceae bacterium]|nr:cobalamin-dependent protein [Nocardioidaceae bacterium]
MNQDAVEYLDALAVADRSRALALVRRVQARGTSPLDVMNDVIAPAQARVGELWASDAWSVAQEHAATAVSEAVLHVLGSQVPPPRDPSSPVVVSCVEQEWHALPALMVAEHLRSVQIPVSYLGANASAEHLVRHVHEVGARAVALSCSLSASLPRVRRQVEAVRATGTPVMVGGAAFDAEGRRAAVLGANAFAATASGAGDVVRRLPTAVSPVAPLTHEGAEDGLAVYADREELTERLRQRIVANGPGDQSSRWRRALLDHLPHVVGALAGALVANDSSILDDALRWLDDVMGHRDAPDSMTEDVLAGLQAVVSEYPAAATLLSRKAPPA